MQITPVSNNNVSCTSKKPVISMDTVLRANEMCIMKGQRAKQLGMTVEEYNETFGFSRPRVFGGKVYDFHKIAEDIVADREKLNASFKKALDSVLGKK